MPDVLINVVLVFQAFKTPPARILTEKEMKIPTATNHKA